VARAAEIVMACLPSADVVEAVVRGKAGVLAGCRTGQVFVDMTTSFPAASQTVAARLAERGVEMLDAPVSGGNKGAQEGTLSIMVGGPAAVFERCRPVFEAMGRCITLMGERVGMGGYAKLTNQIMVSIHLASVAEALVFAARAGLPMDRLIPALEAGWANSTVLNVKAPKVLARDFSPVGTVRVQHKDLSYILRTGEELGVALPYCREIHAMYQRLIDQGKEGVDQMALIHLFEEMSGVEVHG
jgi:3-hydroxyisobutyrate dehydrogenase-like beta-hydroxyacid dehydrogenase